MNKMFIEFFTDRFVSELSLGVICFRVFLAILFGGIVGFEREKNNRPAGFRTHILVCLGATVVSMVEDQLRINLMISGGNGLTLAVGRLGAQVISGVGFLGAGSIMKDKGETIGGMTTAAGIWATACVGLCIGWGFHNIAIVAIIFIIIIMGSLKKVEAKLIRKSRLVCFEVKYNSEENLANVMLECYEVFREKSIRITEIDKDIENDRVIFKVSMKGRNNISEVIVSLSSNEHIEYVRDIA